MAAITMRDVRKSFGQARVIKGVSLEIANKEFVVFVGPCGCGKSTLLRLVAGLEDITAGEIRFDGEVVNELAPAELRDLRRLVRRQQLVQDRRSTKLRIRALLRDSRAQGPAANAWTKVWLEWLRTTTAVTPQTRWIIASQLDCLKFLEEQIRAVEKQLAEVIKEDRIVHEGGRRGTGDRCHLARGNRPLRPFSHGQAVEQVLRPEPAQRLQRRASSGCRTDQGRQRAIARRADRNGSPVDHLPRTMDAIGPETSAGTQAGKCDCCSHRQPLGALVASPHDLARIGLLNVSTNPSTKA